MTQTIRTGDNRRASWVITDPAEVVAVSINSEEWVRRVDAAPPSTRCGLTADLAAVVGAAIPDDDPAWRRRYSERIARAVVRAGYRPAREAEREATPPSGGEGDERGSTRLAAPGTSPDYEQEHARCSPYEQEHAEGCAHPAPVQDEAAVEALDLQDVIDRINDEGGYLMQQGFMDAAVADAARGVMDLYRAALDRGAVPGYGPTGARGGAGDLTDSALGPLVDRRGLLHKYDVVRTDGSSAPGGKHDSCAYFVLDMTHDPHAQPALTAYADDAEQQRPSLVADLRARYDLPTPPPAPVQDEAAVEGDSAWRHCRWNEPHKAVPKPGTEVDVVRATGREGAECATCGEALWRGERKTPLPFAPPSPVQDEAAVEALDDETFDRNRDASLKAAGYDLTDPYPEYSNEAVYEAYRLGWDDRGAVPGYGPTGARGGAGEVVVRRADVEAIMYGAYGSAVTDRLQAALDAS